MAPTTGRWSRARVRPSGARCLGEVRGVRGERIVVELAGPVRRGDGVVFAGDRQPRGRAGRPRVRDLPRPAVRRGGGRRRRWSSLAFRYGAIDLSKIRLGQKVWKTDDPQAARRLRKTSPPARRGVACRWIWWSKPRWEARCASPPPPPRAPRAASSRRSRCRRPSNIR